MRDPSSEEHTRRSIRRNSRKNPHVIDCHQHHDSAADDIDRCNSITRRNRCRLKAHCSRSGEVRRVLICAGLGRAVSRPMSETVTAIFLLGTLKKKHQLSHTQVLCDLVAGTFREQENVESEIIRLRDYDIQPGTRTEIDDDDWPKILDRVLAADIIIFATPIWWGMQSSLMQRAIERMDELNDELL